MAKTNFGHGTIVTPEFLNTMYKTVEGHVHDGDDADGHAGKIDLADHTSGKIDLENQVKGKLDLLRHSSGTIDLETQVRGVLSAESVNLSYDLTSQFTVEGKLSYPDSSSNLARWSAICCGMCPFRAPPDSVIDVNVRFLRYVFENSAALRLTGFLAVVPLTAVNPLAFARHDNWLVLTEDPPYTNADFLQDNVSALNGLLWGFSGVEPPPPPDGLPPPANPPLPTTFPGGSTSFIRGAALPDSSSAHYLAAVGFKTDGGGDLLTYNGVFGAFPYISASVVVK